MVFGLTWYDFFYMHHMFVCIQLEFKNAIYTHKKGKRNLQVEIVNTVIVYFNEHSHVFSINAFFQENIEPFCDVTDDVTKCTDVRHRKQYKLLGMNFVLWSSLNDLHFRVETVFGQIWTP